jgi:uncharacterized protein
MIGDAFVFDGVAHPFNFHPKNVLGDAGTLFANHLYAFHATLTPDTEPKLSAEEFLRQWTPQDIRHMVYDESDTDMLVAMPLPLTDLFKDGLSNWEECADLASRDPDRTIFWGTVNPLEGRKALDDMERQVGEFNAKAFKFYNVRYDYGSPFPLSVFSFQGNHFANVPQIMASVALATAPLLVLYLFACRRLISGLAAGFGS